MRKKLISIKGLKKAINKTPGRINFNAKNKSPFTKGGLGGIILIFTVFPYFIE